MPCDALGGYLLKGFLQRYSIPVPECLYHCIENAEEYDSPEFVAKYQEAHLKMGRQHHLPGLLDG